MKLKQVLAMPLGAVLLAIAVLLEIFGHESGVLSFIIGVLAGMSVVFNIYYIVVKTSGLSKS